MQFKPWKVPTVISRIMIVNTMTLCAMLPSVHDLKSTEMNMQLSLIQEYMLYNFKLDYNTIEATKNIHGGKGEGTVDPNSVTRGFKKFHSG